ncbi:MAG: YybS family protein [Deltaproteobacteria bacterium]|nr:YybS family protein [Deltaproteobacteria bacterium]
MLFNQLPHTAAARLTAAVIGTAVSFILFAAYMVFPPAGFFTGLLAPFPVAFFRLGSGRGTALIITIGVTTLLTAFFGIQAGVLFLLQCGVIALLLPELLLRGYGAARTIAWTTAVNLVVFALAALGFSNLSGQNIHLLAVREINASIAQTLTIYEQAGIKGDELALMRQSMTLAADVIIRIYPALLTVMLIAVTGCNLSLVKRFAGRLGLELEIGSFKDFRNPESLVWLLIAAGFAMLAGNPIITIPALNVLVVITTLYFLQGLAVLLTIIARQSFAGVLRLLLFIMLLFQPYLAALVAALGIFDLWGDFRTPRKQENL